MPSAHRRSCCWRARMRAWARPTRRWRRPAAARIAAPKEQSFAAGRRADAARPRARGTRGARDAARYRRDSHRRPQRRLGLLAFDRGDYEEAQSDFSGAAEGSRIPRAMAVYYLAAIAERRGDDGTALRGYQLLGGTGAGGGRAQSRREHPLQGRASAMTRCSCCRPSDDAAPPARLEAEIAQAQLLSNGGEADQALARIDDALARFPGSSGPALPEGDPAGKGRSHRCGDCAAGELCIAIARRTARSAMRSGFMLADHNRDLARADRLINVRAQIRTRQPGHSRQPGWLEYRRGMLQAALPLLERAFRLDQDGDIGAHWGEVLWALGDKAKAREAWNRALMVDPDNALVKAAQQRAGVPPLPAHGTGTSI